jgi:aminopeptidase
MSLGNSVKQEPEFGRWLPLAKQVVRHSLGLRWNDVFEIYSYIPTIPLAEALALEARRAGSDTHITLMTDDLWFTSMEELPTRWLRAPSQAEIAINKAATAYVYLGGPRDARRMRRIPAEKFEANTLGNIKQDEPKSRRRVRAVDLPIGRVCPERAEAYGLNYELWQQSYNSALAVDLRDIQRAAAEWLSKLRGKRKVHVVSDSGTDLKFEIIAAPPMVDDGVISTSDVRRGFVETSLPAGKIVSGIVPGSAEGEACFSDPVFLMGRSVRGLHLEFKKGKLVHWNAEENAELLTSTLRDRGRTGNQLGWFSIGLNSAAQPCMLDNGIVQNDIGIGLNPHPLLEPSKIRRDGSFEATIGLAEVKIG